MKMLVRIAAIALFLPALAWASEAGYPLDAIEPDHTNLPSLQRGAALFTGYCQGCHGLQYQRHIRTADDLGIPHELYKANLMPDGADIGSHITSSMPVEGSKAWFGAPPPDLTMVTRARSPEWVYTYLRTFYLDDSRPLGVNNEVLANAGMPHALIELQGVPRKVCEGEHHCTIEVEPGTGLMSAGEYDAAVYDLVNYLDYTAEPYKLDRQRIGIYVLLFLVVLFVFTYLLGREYGKEVH
ncbi:MAG TPA: cytochrome c1 [Pseudomonadales bacterium]|nr:cytochrome c1 [Pseudomonadales bacterium]